MTIHNGIIELGTIENIGKDAEKTGSIYARFVQYPDCQQLQVWLPVSKDQNWEYGNYQIINSLTKNIVEKGLVSEKVNGSVQMLFDTISLTEGDFILEIEYSNSGKHSLKFHKYEEGFTPALEMPIQESNVDRSMFKVYKDGFGNDIPNEDEILRKKADDSLDDIFNKIFEKDKILSPRLEYIDQGRSGRIIYIENEIRIEFYHEIGGGVCKMYIDIPAEAVWEKETNTTLDKRREILLFICSSIIRDQAPDWRFEIQDEAILFY